MTWIALKMLVGDKAKFFGIVLGLTFAALLITQQGSIFCGLMSRTAGQIYDITGADLWVMDANVQYIDDTKPMIENSLYLVRGVPGVEWAVPLYKGIGRAKINSESGLVFNMATGKRVKNDLGQDVRRDYKVIEQVILLGLDDTTLVGAPPPERIIVGSLRDLSLPDSVIVDYTRLRKLFPGEPWDELPEEPGMLDQLRYGLAAAMDRAGVLGRSLQASPDEQYRRELEQFYKRFIGRELEMNDHRAIIIGVCEATRTFQSNAVVYTRYSRAKQFVPRERKFLSYILAKTTESQAPEVVADRIKGQTGLKARSSHQFIWDTIWYYFQYTGIPINFGITVALGFLVGTAIAGQTFYNFTIENIRQFGALKAMGTTNGQIIGMILLQAFVVGLLGYGLGVGLAAMFGQANQGGELAYYTPWQLLPISAGAVLMICMLASLISVRRVVVLEPAVVFRG